MADNNAPDAESAASSSRSRGRPRKYATEEEVQAAKRASDRKSSARDRSAETDIEKEFKRIRAMLISSQKRLAKIEQNPNVHRRSDSLTADELRARIAQLEPQIATMEPLYQAAIKARHGGKGKDK